MYAVVIQNKKFVGNVQKVISQAAQAYSLYFVWNFGSERFIRLCMGI